MSTSHSTVEGEAWNAAFNDNNETNTTTTTSSTACSFWGSALSSESININKEKTDTNNSNSNKTAGGDKNEDSLFECIMCLDTAKNPVVTTCGHLFCWPCLYLWMKTKPLCPVCESAISEDNVTPIYGHDSTNHEYPSNEVPPRPDGQRTQQEPVIPTTAGSTHRNDPSSLGQGLSTQQTLLLQQQQQQQEPVKQKGFRGFNFCGFQIPFGIETCILFCIIYFIFIIIYYFITKYRKSHSWPKYKDVLYSNKNHEIYTQPQK